MPKADATLHYHKRPDQEDSATSIEQLTQALQRKDLELRTFIRAAAAVLGKTSFDESARAIFDECAKAIGSTSGYVALLSDDGSENEILFLEDGGAECTVDPDLPMPIRGLRADAYHENCAVYCNDFMHSEWIKYMPSGHMDLRNVMFSPLVIEGKTVGIMGMANKDGDFTDRDAEIATVFGELAAIALQNGRLLESQQQAYEQLKRSQSIFLQQEKMASIGQLAAGVAHEINNPISFVKSNMQTLRKHLNSILNYTAAQQQLIEQLPRDTATLFSGDKSRLDFILKDSQEIIDESLEGIERTSTIVQSLKTFSRTDQGTAERVNISSCINSALNILANEIKYRATVTLDLTDNIPEIFCNRQQIEQVLINLLMNAVQAIESDEGRILIQTLLDEHDIKVLISDNGVGIPAEALSRVFEPFFTTKEVGKGTGLGMSLSYDIIHQHGGDIRVASEVGKGTTVTLILPQATDPTTAKPGV